LTITMKSRLMYTKVSFLVALGATLLTVSGCSRQEAPQEPIRAVKLITVGAGTLAPVSEYAGEVRARIESRLGFRVPGKLTQRLVESGQRVQAGQLLAQIDPQDYQLAAQAAQAAVVAAQSHRDVALADFKRYEALRAQNFISRAELERREAALKAAESALTQAQSQLGVQSNQTGYARLLATASGVVTGIEAESGQVVSAGQPVVRLAHDGPRDAVFSVPEQALGAFRVGQPLQATLQANGQVLKGQVREVGASADPLTRTFQIKLALQASQALPVGVTVNVQAPRMQALAAQQIIKLPTSALRQEGQATAVWLLDEASMTVKPQPVQVQAVDGQEVVIASGLSVGQKVVAAGVHVLSPGQKVTVYNPPLKAAQ